jgi:hypothetical protein
MVRSCNGNATVPLQKQKNYCNLNLIEYSSSQECVTKW